MITLTRKIQHNLVKDDALGTRNGEPAGSNGHVASVGKRERATLPLASRALAGSANLGALLADSDKRTLAILELRRRAAAAKRRGFLVARMLLLADWLGLVLAFAAADALLGSTGNPGEVSALAELRVFAATLPLWTVAAKVYGLYDNDDERTDPSTADDLVGVFHLVTVGTWVLFVGTRLAGFAQPHVWRLVAFWALAIALIALARGLARAYCRRRITYLQNVVIVGAGRVGRVIFAFSSQSEPSTRELVQSMKELDIQVDIVPRLFEAVGPSASIHTIEGVPLMSLPPVGPSPGSGGYGRTCCRAASTVCSTRRPTSGRSE